MYILPIFSTFYSKMRLCFITKCQKTTYTDNNSFATLLTKQNAFDIIYYGRKFACEGGDFVKNYFENIIGNEHITKRLSRDVDDGCVNHAFILEGAFGSGRHTIAKTLAASIECREKKQFAPCKKCSSCIKIFEGKSPDIITVGLEDDKVTLGVDSVRFIKNDMSIMPNDLGTKMYIIENADKMTLQAQNAFLLSLEEPPPYVIFILICENSSSLLETIKSRAPILRTEKLTQEEISEYLMKNSKAKALYDESNEDYFELICAANGSIGRALSLLDSKERKKVFSDRRIAKEFMTLSLERSRAKAFDMIASLGTKRPEIIFRLIQIKLALRDLTMLKKSDAVELCFYADMEMASDISARFTMQKLMLMDKAIDDAIDSLSRNANVKLSLLCMVYNAGIL